MKSKLKLIYKLIILFLIIFITSYLIHSNKKIYDHDLSINEIVGNIYSTYDLESFISFETEEEGTFYYNGAYIHFTFVKNGNIFILEDLSTDFSLKIIVSSKSSFYSSHLNQYFYLYGDDHE